jgi:ribosomal protein L37AE/L43A|tara:strand:- start:167 stop:712 length:546 start_codon:yes stop_codon:yes gene_type:complete
MGYSKESERENKVLGDLLSGRDPEKRIMVGYNSGKEPEKHGDKIHRLSDIMKEARMPWFCPSCKKTMKKRLDDKFWRLMGHCFDCQVEMENKLRVRGEYEEWEKNKILENKKAYLKDLKQSIDDFEKTGGKAEFFNEVGVDRKGVEKEEWSMGQENFDKLVEEAREYIDKLETELEDETTE